MTLLSGRHTGLEHHVAQGGLHHFPLQLVDVSHGVYHHSRLPQSFCLGYPGLHSNVQWSMSGVLWLLPSGSFWPSLEDALSWDSPFLKPVSADLSEQSSPFIHLSYAFLVDPPSWNTSLPLSYKVCAHFFKLLCFQFTPMDNRFLK